MSRHWEVRGSLPPETVAASQGHPAYKWRKNVTCHVVAESAGRALELTEQKHPGIEVWDIHHRGEIDIIEDQQAVPGEGG
jgi:hypothetical protein